MAPATDKPVERWFEQYMHALYRERGRPAVISLLAKKLSQQPEPAR